MTEASPPRRRDPEATRAAILDAAEELFLDLGPAATSTNEIARRAGVTKSLIHHHFGSKDELWSEVRLRHFNHYFELQKGLLVSRQGTAELLRDSLIGFFYALRDDPGLVRLMAWRFVESDDPCLEQEEELFELGIARITEAQEAGDLRDDVEPLHVIKAMLALALNWFQSRALLCQMMDGRFDNDDADERYLEDAVRLLLDGARPSPAATSSPTEVTP